MVPLTVWSMMSSPLYLHFTIKGGGKKRRVNSFPLWIQPGSYHISPLFIEQWPEHGAGTWPRQMKRRLENVYSGCQFAQIKVGYLFRTEKTALGKNYQYLPHLITLSHVNLEPGS